MTVIEVPTPTYPLTDMQSIVFSIFWRAGSFTDTELGNYYAGLWELRGWPRVRHDSPRKRRSELAALGLLVDSGMKRPNGFGSDERVWMLAEVAS